MNGVMCYTNEDLNKSFKSIYDSPKCFSVFADGRDQTLKEYMYDSGKIGRWQNPDQTGSDRIGLD